MQLRIDQVWGRVGIKQTPPFLHLSIFEPRLDLDIKPPVLIVEHDRVELSIDAKACRADVHQYDLLDFARMYAAQAERVCAEGVARAAEEGDRLAAIESGEKDAIAAIAWENSMDDELILEAVPAHLPEIKFQIIKGKGRFEPGSVDVRLQPGRVELELERGAVSIFWRQHPELHIWVTGSRGSRVDVFA